MDTKHLNLESLKKGSTIPKDALERCVGLPAEHKDFSLKTLHVKAVVREWFRRERNEVVTVVFRNSGLAILDDPNSSVYNSKQMANRMRGCVRDFHQLQHVDPGNLTYQQREEHLRRLEAGSRYVQAIRRVRAEIKNQAYQRTTPGVV
jgi:hypothetical protein